MAWYLFDDLTHNELDPKTAHKLALTVDGYEIESWDVGSIDHDELLAQLGEALSGVAAPLACPVTVVRRCRVCGCTDDDCTECAIVAGEPCTWVETDLCSRCDAPEPALGEEGPDTNVGPNLPTAKDPSEPEPVAAVGEATSGRASDATVRAWCAKRGVPHSTHGRLNAAAREAYDRAHGGEPNAQTIRDEPPAAMNGHALPADPPRTSSADDETPLDDGRIRYDVDPDPVGADRIVEPAAVEPIAQPRTHAQLLDQAEALLAEKKTPAQVAQATGLSVEEVRDLLPRPGTRRR